MQRFWAAGSFQRYVEPFAGSAAVFFLIEPPSAILADLNDELIGAFAAVQQDPCGVHAAMARLSTGREAYYRVRAQSVSRLSPERRAARFIYLNRFCFNGLYRTNRAGRFNVPYGAPKTDNLPAAHHLRTCAALLARAKLFPSDFRSTLALAGQGDFVYLDPPYAVQARRVFVEYGAAPFSVDDLDDLRNALIRLDRDGAVFLLSYADCREAREKFAMWPRRRLAARRHVAGFTGARRTQYELYVSNSPEFRRLPGASTGDLQ